MVNQANNLEDERFQTDWNSYFLERFATRTPLFELISRVIRKETEVTFDVYLEFTVQCI